MSASADGIAERLDAIRRALPPGVTLVAVSKGQPVEAIRAAYAAGQRDFGENYVQEWRAKAEALSDLPDLAWHFIGGLQTNKVKYLVGRIALLHTVDRLALGEEVARRSAAAGLITPVLVEVNLGGEAAKAGCSPADAPALVSALRTLPGLAVRGLMAVPPADEPARPHFAALRRLRDAIGDLPVLSMGMSGDFPDAVAEGATLVRVGTAIFGARPPRRPEPA